MLHYRLYLTKEARFSFSFTLWSGSAHFVAEGSARTQRGAIAKALRFASEGVKACDLTGKVRILKVTEEGHEMFGSYRYLKAPGDEARARELERIRPYFDGRAQISLRPVSR